MTQMTNIMVNDHGIGLRCDKCPDKIQPEDTYRHELNRDGCVVARWCRDCLKRIGIRG